MWELKYPVSSWRDPVQFKASAKDELPIRERTFIDIENRILSEQCGRVKTKVKVRVKRRSARSFDSTLPRIRKARVPAHYHGPYKRPAKVNVPYVPYITGKIPYLGINVVIMVGAVKT